MRKFTLFALLMAVMSILSVSAKSFEETLSRGLVGVKTSDGVFLSWRFLDTDSKSTTFNLYRDGTLVAGNLSTVTNYTDAEGTASSSYALATHDADGVLVDSVQLSSANIWSGNSKRIALNVPADGVDINGITYSYRPNDASVGDVDGDGEYEIILKWDPSNSHDNSQRGYTGNVYLDCYELDGTQLWRIDLGCNIRAGAHYTQFLVYDFDGDGKAEVACKTAPGSKDGAGNYVTAAATDETIKNATDNETSYVTTKSGSTLGTILSGPEYLTIFSGQTGAALHTVNYNPPRSIISNSSWGDSYGNRCERYLACVSYLPDDNGVPTPSLVMCRGYYTYAYVCAWQFNGTELSQRWLYSTTSTSQSTGLYEAGAHAITTGDIDNDGYDEIIYGAAALDHDGSFLYNTGWEHGDALHLGDFDPDRDGMEVFMPHENKGHAGLTSGSTMNYGLDMHDALTGEIIWGYSSSSDNGRGLAADIDGNNRGYEFWSQESNNVYDVTGTSINSSVLKRPSVNFRIYWDGDLQDELLDGTSSDSNSERTKFYIQKWNSSTKTLSTLATYDGYTCNTTKATPCFMGDIFGDWREEVIVRDSLSPTDKGLVIYTTTIPSEYRVTTLPQDHTYRMAMAWQNCAYNQPPHLGYFLPDLFESNAALSLTSGSRNQAIEIGESITDIILTWKRAESVTVEGLPDGVTASIDNDAMTVTISGTPTAIGTYEYIITTTGMEEGGTAATFTGTITVKNPDVLTLVASFSFDDNLLNAVTNTEASAVDFTPSYVSGISNNAINFSSSTTSAHVSQPHYDEMNLSTQNFTISLWFNSTSEASTTGQYIFHKGSTTASSSTGASGCWVGLEYKRGALTFSIDDNVTKSSAALSDATPYFDGNWHNVVCVRNTDDSSLLLYIDGKLVASASDDTDDISETEELVIGNSTVSYNCPFSGSVDEFMIYTGAMGAGTIADRYEEISSTGIGSVVVKSSDWVSVRKTVISNQINMSFNTAPQSVKVSLVDLSGSVVYSSPFNIDGHETLTVSGFDGLSSGLYILIIEGKDGTVTKKIIKS
ncbi:MAG: LamG-like jellyroll fold domain-containing protein [Prevotellaceae bacterium]|nr:LamG-like jellyroll fold domain-containing protein [Prevotellaceae bacterium]